MDEPSSNAKGRGSPIQPPNRFAAFDREADTEHGFAEDDSPEDRRPIPTQFIPDTSASVVTENDSPDVPFRYSLNPYRGCEHGCSYCYARPSHEYLGLSAGLDFETKVFVKERAPELFREWLARDAWQPEMICFSGVTDCYQPAERMFGLTRGCLEVALESRQPIGIISKNALVTRDLDLLAAMARERIVHVSISITTLDEGLARRMEPRTSPPAARLRTLTHLAQAGVPVRVMAAPIIPGLNDSEIPLILKAAADAGAQSAGFVLLRLSGSVRPVFLDWLKRNEPTKAAKVEAHIRHTRGGKLNDTTWGKRMRGQGAIAEQVGQTFKMFVRRYGLDGKLEEFDFSRFQPPRMPGSQLRLF